MGTPYHELETFINYEAYEDEVGGFQCSPLLFPMGDIHGYKVPSKYTRKILTMLYKEFFYFHISSIAKFG
jgi:hypothetical protein